MQGPPAGIGVNRPGGGRTKKRAEMVHPRLAGGFRQVRDIREFSTDRAFVEIACKENKQSVGTAIGKVGRGGGKSMS